MDKTTTLDPVETKFQPVFWFYYDPWIIIHPQTPTEGKLKTALREEASFLKSDDVFWMRCGGLIYPIISTTVLAFGGYLLAKSVERMYLKSEFEAIEAAMQREQQLLQNLPPKRAIKFMPRVEAKKYEHLINLDKSGPAAFDKFEAVKKEILSKSKLRVKAIVAFLGASGFIHGLIRSRVSFHNYSKTYENDLNNFRDPNIEQKP